MVHPVLRLHQLLLKKPEPIPENNTDDRWKYFKLWSILEAQALCVEEAEQKDLDKNNETKSLYGVAFPHYDTLATIYGRDIATGEGVEGLGEVVTNMEKEIDIQDVEDKEDEEESVSRETHWRSVDSTASSSKKRKKDKCKLKDTLSNEAEKLMRHPSSALGCMLLYQLD
ncbi:hypothetical protein E2562_029734 [Oryza meyeriana var. granulata]|uniref:Uncharacterized protein n=1 Tax=Oryza meyeriana var. granulata TaxID=110450 RepID=A0A6G1ER60_9ORYZ|nr:hypothetical protein E2562_029734 [Oryza meyeriana var. granulata]